jgi:hypothetical protein
MAPKLFLPTKFGQSLIIEEAQKANSNGLVMIMMAVFGLRIPFRLQQNTSKRIGAICSIPPTSSLSTQSKIYK